MLQTARRRIGGSSKKLQKFTFCTSSHPFFRQSNKTAMPGSQVQDYFFLLGE